MAHDPIGERFARREKQSKLDDLARRAKTKEEIEAEEKLLKETKKVEPIRSGEAVGRNDPCPCGSGKKYKSCCAKKG